MSLTEWDDLLVDDIIFPEVGKDEWGNRVITPKDPVKGAVISHIHRGGSQIGEDATEQEQLEEISFVVPYETKPMPKIGMTVVWNDIEWEITNVTIHRDIDGRAYEISAVNMEETNER